MDLPYLISWVFPVRMKSNYTEGATGKRWRATWIQWAGRQFYVERSAA